MKLAKIATAVALTTLAASAFAGPDWDVIQRARQAAQQHQAAAAKAQMADKNMGADCMQMMTPKLSSEAAPQQLGAIGTHGTTYSDSDATSNRIWGVVLSSATGERSPFQDGGRNAMRDVYTDGARKLAGMDLKGVSSAPYRTVDSYLDGARSNQDQDVFAGGARMLAGLDMKGVSSAPARAVDPYLDGARVTDRRDVFTDGGRVSDSRDVYSDGARVTDKRDVFTDGARTLAGMDTTGVSAPPSRYIDPYSDGARSNFSESVA